MKKEDIRFILALIIPLGVLSSVPASTITVTNSADSGPGTFRQNIFEEKMDQPPEPMVSEFNISVANPNMAADGGKPDFIRHELHATPRSRLQTQPTLFVYSPLTLSCK